LHWIDSETQSLLDSLIESLPTARLLLLVNYRPEYQHGWGSKTYYSQLRIDPLPPESAGELLQAVLGDDANLQPLKRILIERTEGNPFFLEESLRTLVETKMLVGERGSYRLVKPIESTYVPATVQAVLAARIDRLPPEEKRLLQTAAVIGKDVPFPLLQVIADQPEEELLRGLTSLQAAEFLYETSLFPDPEYTFKHALTHEVAYGTLLQERRRLLHARIVEAIERLYPDRLVEQVELLAHHAVRGELWDKAVSHLQEAGRKAAARSAHRGAADYFRQALDGLGRLPESRPRLKQAIDIRVDLGPVLIALEGYSSAEVERNYTQAREMCDRAGDTPQLFPVLWGLARVYDHRRGYNMGRELGEQLLALAERLQDPALLLEAHHELWASLVNLGELTSALAHAERGIKLYHPEEHHRHAFLYGGHDPGVCGLRNAAMTLWLLGYPVQALKRSREALALAESLSHSYSLTHALYYAAWVHEQRGEKNAVKERVEAAIALATEQGFARWLAQGAVLQGWLLAQEGKSHEGILKMRQGAAAMRVEPYNVALLAEAYAKEGQTEEGLRVIGEQLALEHKTGERFYDAELHRIRGELLLTQAVTNEQEAESSFKKALEVAQSQKAKSLELRATMSLSRLWQRQGKRDEARKLLAEIYEWFTEGFDTADLKEAKALLEELS
jgi:predicted ATPase